MKCHSSDIPTCSGKQNDTGVFLCREHVFSSKKSVFMKVGTEKGDIFRTANTKHKGGKKVKFQPLA